MNKWKEASSLIISTACKSQISNKGKFTDFHLADDHRCNFEILSLKKRQNVKIGKPRFCVFPGGGVSNADSVKTWEHLFSSYGLTLHTLSSSLVSQSMIKLPIFDSKNEAIPRWLSLRITAIRETFEESGILLCKSTKPNQIPSASTLSLPTTSHLEVEHIHSWRTKVLEDPFQFLSLCEQCSCYPDVENLYLWSNWLTPSHQPDRFDAVFFVTSVNNNALYRGSPDLKEIASTEWLKPEELLSLSDRGEIWLKPPQWYEIKSLLNIKDMSRLQHVGLRRGDHCERWMPVRVVANDGEISLLPGDDMYPGNVDLFKDHPIFRRSESMESLRCEHMFRMEHHGVRTVMMNTIENKE